MLLEQVCLLFSYILFIEIAIVTVISVVLFIAVVAMMSKLDTYKKHTSAGN